MTRLKSVEKFSLGLGPGGVGSGKGSILVCEVFLKW